MHALLEGPGQPAQARSGGVFALVVLGFIAMACQLAILFSYQAQVGLVYERVALFNGLFMTGLALCGGTARPTGPLRPGATGGDQRLHPLQAGGVNLHPL